MLIRTPTLALIVAAACASVACSRPAEPPASARQDIPLAPAGHFIEAKVPANATLETLLRQHDLPKETAGSLLQAIGGVFNPRHLRANQDYSVLRSFDGFLREFRYQIDADRFLRVVSAATSAATASLAPAFTAEVVTLPKTFELDALACEIGKGESLIGVLESAGENVQLALEMASVFGGVLDFNSDLQPGDRCELLFERAVRNGQFAGYGEIKAAVFVNEGRRFTAVRSTDPNGQTAWYDEDGRSLKRQFLKSPLPFDPRVTSRFSTRRFHPVHGRYRAHLGVDYGAPYGTPVLSVAHGVVEFAGWSGEAGRMVRIKHAGGYQTAYLHLSGFGPGIRPGVKVSQGQLIGRVGATGTATGPHLDYRIIRSGTYVDPVAEHRRMPAGEPIAPSELPAFRALRDDTFGRMAEILATKPIAPPVPQPPVTK
jgi:murein DD-endopeptidase MepM/ murein hydrolase activator NlpD